MKLPSISFSYIADTTEDFAKSLRRVITPYDCINPKKVMMLGFVIDLEKRGAFPESGKYHVTADLNWKGQINGTIEKL
jgi:hypothetical protein